MRSQLQVLTISIILLTMLAGCHMDTWVTPDINLEHRLIGEQVFLKWDRHGNTDLYLVQGSFMDGEWDNVGMNTDPVANVRVSRGVFRFRVQGWNEDGPVFMSSPTPYIYVRPQRTVPDAQKPGPNGQNYDPDGPRTANP